MNAMVDAGKRPPPADREKLAEAEQWLTKALAIYEDVDHRPGMGRIYLNLGTVTGALDRAAEAEVWLGKAYAIADDLGPVDRCGAYLIGGFLAAQRGAPDEAEACYSKAFAISDERGAHSLAASACAMLVGTCEARGDHHSALTWAIRGSARFEDFPHPGVLLAAEQHGDPETVMSQAALAVTGRLPADLTRLTAMLGFDALEASWPKVVGSPLPPTVRGFVRASSEAGPGSAARPTTATRPRRWWRRT